ncbi:NAD-dependent epimerase/dehydratase family protein [Cellulomonas sp. P5_C6]
MRVVVIGATGNVGTAVLRRLRSESAVDSLVAVTRRIPQRGPAPPFDAVTRWVSCDVSRPDARDVLVDAVRGAAAVIHLAWAIQPSHDRTYLRSTNVDGTRAVLDAVDRANVPHLIVASSVGTYASTTDDDPRDESWPATGVESSSYSSDKATVETLLDDASDASFGIARLRPSLVFQRAAGAEIGRLFLGPLVPKRVLGGPIPVLPWPRGLRLQGVHADDLADAYVRVVNARATGAFNVAGDGVLGAADVARVLGARSVVQVDPRLVRAALLAAWQARLAVAGPGWLDMAMGAPVLDSSRLRDELGWRPTHTGAKALAEVVHALARGVGAASPALHPRARLLRATPRAETLRRS